MLRRTWLPVLPVLLVLGLTHTPAADAQPDRSTRTVAATSTYEFTTVQFENRLLSRTNTRRARVGCAALRLHSSLITAARGHSARMARTDQLSHQLSGELSFGSRITRAGYTDWTMLAENIAWGSPTPPVIFQSWMNSAPHRRNIDNCRLRHIGLGVSYGGGHAWVTMDLGRR
jgi:uncharacterized protein YkwD